MVAVAAYAYEFLNTPIMTDAQFDRMCLRIKTERSTGNRKLDKWFIQNFDPSTGMWVHKHPDKAGLERIAKLIINDRRSK